MNLGEMQAELLLMMDNMPSSDPFYLLVHPTTGNEKTNILLRAANRLIRMAIGPNRENADSFPELHDTWTAGPTAVGNNAVPRPSDCIAVQSVTCAHSATLPNWATTREYSVNFVDRQTFGWLLKDSTVRTDYPTLYTLVGKLVMIHPTPDAAHLDYLRYYGIAEESPVSNAADSFVIDDYWHPLVVKLGAAMLGSLMGWDQESAKWMAEVTEEVGRTMNVSAAEIRNGSVDLSGVMPTADGGLWW